ncbi:MAG: type II toxin-antitoxin system HicA family toxin [Candidatus Nitrosoglobus sp.]
MIAVLRKDGWIVVRQRGSHIRLQKHTRTELLKLTVPAHRPIKHSTAYALSTRRDASVTYTDRWLLGKCYGCSLSCCWKRVLRAR